MRTGLKVWLGAASVAAMALGSTASYAQSDSVLMRRPLPSLLGTNGTPASSTPSTGTPDPSGPSDPTDSGDGTSTSSTPTSSTQPGTAYDPGLEIPVTDPPSYAVGVATYVVGPWVGSGQCGQKATFTRTVSCDVVGPAGGGFPSIGMVDPNAHVTPGDDGRVMNASYSPDAAGGFSHAIYDPASSDVKATLAQFGTIGSDGLKHTSMPVQYCMDNGAGDPPANTYTGTQGGCDYHEEEDPGSVWQLDPGSSGTATCSADAYKIPSYSCYDQDGNEVDLDYCVENIRSGGDRQSDLVDPQYGNYSGCRTGWVGYPTDNLCYEPTAVPGQVSQGEQFVESSNHWAYYDYKCMRSDGTELTDSQAAACTDPQPQSGWKVVGSCTKVYYPGSGNAHCVLGDNDENLIGVIAQSADTPLPYTGGSSFCASNGAACCGLRIASNYDANDGQYEIVAAKTAPVVGTGYYFDEVNKRINPKEEGVLSLWYGAGAGQYLESYGEGSVDIDDPNGVLSGSNGGGVSLPPIG